MDRFEDSMAWQKSRVLNKAIYLATRSGPVTQDREFVRQIRRASLSVMNNIAEGFERFRPAEQRQFLSIAKGSAGEVRSMLHAGMDFQYWPEDVFTTLQHQSPDVTNVLGGWIVSIERRKSSANTELREDSLPWDVHESSVALSTEQ